jgi:hypothetical protein
MRPVAHANRIAGEGKKLARFYPKMKVLYMSGYTDAAVARHGKLSRDARTSRNPLRLKSWRVRYVRPWTRWRWNENNPLGREDSPTAVAPCLTARGRHRAIRP